MILKEGDFVLANQAIKGLTERQEDSVNIILDIHLVPRMWGDEFGVSTYIDGGADVLLVTGTLQEELNKRIEEATGKQFEDLSEDELQQVRNYFSSKEGNFKFVP